MRTVPQSSKSPIRFEGTRAEEYKRMRNKWIRLSIVSTGLPFLFSIIISFFNDALSFWDLIVNGEIILSLFSLNLPIVFDLFEMKNSNEEYMSVAFWISTVITLLQLVVYCSIRMSVSESKELKTIIASLLMIIASWISCRSAIRAMFQYSISDTGSEDTNASSDNNLLENGGENSNV